MSDSSLLYFYINILPKQVWKYKSLTVTFDTLGWIILKILPLPLKQLKTPHSFIQSFPRQHLFPCTSISFPHAITSILFCTDPNCSRGNWEAVAYDSCPYLKVVFAHLSWPNQFSSIIYYLVNYLEILCAISIIFQKTPIAQVGCVAEPLSSKVTGAET